MKRREFIKSGSALAMGTTFLHPVNSIRRFIQDNRDKYGGWKGKKYDATGFFHLVKDDRWWLVTPEGNAFISFGVNHYHAGWWNQDYNRDHWIKVFGALQPWDQKWQEGFIKTAQSDLGRLGLNTLGIHTDTLMTDPPMGPIIPYVRRYEPILFSWHMRPKPEAYVDIFAPEFESQCDKTAREMAAPFAEDPMLLGYCMSDVPIMTDNDAEWSGGHTWPRILRNLGTDAPGKKAYVTTMKKRYNHIAAFNSTYGTNFASWDELARAENWRSPAAPVNNSELGDNHAFLLQCVDRYYSTAKAALQRYDPHHLLLGDKLNTNSDALNKILEVTSKYTDLVNYQFYARWSEQKKVLDYWSLKVDLPFLNGDSQFTVPDEMMPNPYGPHAKDHAERALWIREFCEGAFAQPEFVGWHMCGIIDTWKTMPGKAEHQHQGLMTVTGEFYPEVEETILDISSRLYGIATGKQTW